MNLSTKPKNSTSEASVIIALVVLAQICLEGNEEAKCKPLNIDCKVFFPSFIIIGVVYLEDWNITNLLLKILFFAKHFVAFWNSLHLYIIVLNNAAV